MTDPTPPRSRGRHSQPDGADAGRPASELLASWAGADTLQLADDDTMRPRRRRRHAPETDAAGVQVLPPRPAADVADVGITGLAATGIADVGLAAAGLDLSAYGIDRAEAPRRSTDSRPARSSWTGQAADPAPRTTEMLAVPPAVPHLTDDAAAGHAPQIDRRLAPAPRVTAQPSVADRVVADRFADADTDPGWLSATGRPVHQAAVPVPPRAASPVAQPVARPVAPPVAPPAAEPQAAAAGTLASLFTAPPVTGLPAGHPSEPLPELATEVHAAVGADRFDDVEDDHGWQAASARHRGEFDDEPEHHEHVDAHPHEEHDDHLHDDHLHDDHAAGSMVFDETGGLEVVVIDDHDDHDGHDGGSGGGGGRGRRGGRGGRGGGSGRRRKRRGPITIVLSLLVLVGLVAGIGIGGKALWDQLNPVAEDYTGTGTGEVDVRVEEGDSLRAIAATLVDADVIASSDPFEEAADANPAATGIQPGVYRLRSQMSGQAALDLLLDPASRQVSKVTIPEGLTQVQILDRLAEQTGMPLADLQAAAADTAALGLPPYANGVLEGWLFPATYDIEPGDTPATVLSEMVAGAVRVLDELQVPEAERLAVLTEASIVQAEAGSVEDMGMVARVLDNRLAIGMPLQLDTTVNYANGKSGVTTTAEDRANPSPYNTYANPGLPPGAISNPGEDALRAVQNPTPGDWLFFVVVDPDTGETRFAATKEEHDANVLLFQQWLRDNPGN